MGVAMTQKTYREKALFLQSQQDDDLTPGVPRTTLQTWKKNAKTIEAMAANPKTANAKRVRTTARPLLEKCLELWIKDTIVRNPKIVIRRVDLMEKAIEIQYLIEQRTENRSTPVQKSEPKDGVIIDWDLGTDQGLEINTLISSSPLAHPLLLRPVYNALTVQASRALAPRAADEKLRTTEELRIMLMLICTEIRNLYLQKTDRTSQQMIIRLLKKNETMKYPGLLPFMTRQLTGEKIRGLTNRNVSYTEVDVRIHRECIRFLLHYRHFLVRQKQYSNDYWIILRDAFTMEDISEIILMYCFENQTRQDTLNQKAPISRSANSMSELQADGTDSDTARSDSETETTEGLTTMSQEPNCRPKVKRTLLDFSIIKQRTDEDADRIRQEAISTGLSIRMMHWISYRKTILVKEKELAEDYQEVLRGRMQRRRIICQSSSEEEEGRAISPEARVRIGNQIRGRLDGFLHRHSLLTKMQHGQSEVADRDRAKQWLDQDFQTVYRKYGPQNIFNADETGFFYKQLPTRSLVESSKKQPSASVQKERLSVLFAVSMAGERLPPLVIGNTHKPGGYNNTTTQPYLWAYNANSWMTSMIWEAWLKTIDDILRHKMRKIALIVDNCAAHTVSDRLTNIELAFIPPNLTSILQPCDQGIIHTVKAHYRSKLVRMHLDAIEQGREIKPQKITYVLMIVSSFYEIADSTIIHCFRHAGWRPMPSTEKAESIIKSAGVSEQESLHK